jgi:hypothetical protein
MLTELRVALLDDVLRAEGLRVALLAAAPGGADERARERVVRPR